MTNSDACSSHRPRSASRMQAAVFSVWGAALAAGLLLTLGCAGGEIRLGDPFDRQFSFEDAQHRYSILTRWSKFQESQHFVAKAERAAYLKRMKAFKETRFTDFEVDEAELDGAMGTAKMTVVYTMYTASSPYETKITETQIWSRDGLSNNWYVKSTFEMPNKMAAN